MSTAFAVRPDVDVDEVPVTRLGPQANGTTLSPEEFDAIEDWDPAFRYELIRGVVIVSPIPLEGEADPNEELGRLL